MATAARTRTRLTTPLVAIVGRPNVGKSSLFNAMVGRREAITSDIAGTTRDRVTDSVEYRERRLLLVDTGGLVPEPDEEMEAQVASQVGAALAEADAVVFVVDVVAGATHADRAIAQRLRETSIPVILAANKVDGQRQEAFALEMHELAMGPPVLVSAIHRTGIDDLFERVVATLPPSSDEAQTVRLPRFAIVGRPNVGKSSMANAILGEERAIVSAVPGTTRDAVDGELRFEGREAVIVDTAGLRKRGAVEPGIERYSVLRAIRAIDDCDVAILVLDATEPATAQDLHIAGQVMEAFKGVVVAVNKADLLEGEGEEVDPRSARRAVLSRLHFMEYAPVVVTSATQGRGIDHLLRTAFAVYDERMAWTPPSRLMRVVMDAVGRHLPPKQGRRALKIYRVKQEAVGPPTFVFYCNNPSLMHFSYERYLENALRDAFGFEGNHLRLEFRGKGKLHVIGGHRTGRDAARNPPPQKRG